MCRTETALGWFERGGVTAAGERGLLQCLNLPSWESGTE